MKYKADPRDGTPDQRLIYDLWDEWNFCGCGATADVLGLIRDRLADKKNGKLRRPNTPLEWLLEYVLDARDLTEHGTSISGSWLTPKGEKVLACLQRYEDLDNLIDGWDEIGLEPA